MTEKKKSVFGSKEKMHAYEQENLPKRCNVCLRLLTKLETPNGLIDWCLTCDTAKYSIK